MPLPPPPKNTQNKTEKCYKQNLKMISTDLTNQCTYDVSFVICSMMLSKFGIKLYLFKEYLVFMPSFIHTISGKPVFFPRGRPLKFTSYSAEYFTMICFLNSQIPPYFHMI